MSLRWIHENLEPPNVDEECSDIDDSCSGDDSYDSDVIPNGSVGGGSGDNDSGNNNYYGNAERAKRETLQHPTTTITIDQFGNHEFKTEKPEKTTEPCVPWDPERTLNNPVHQSLKLKLFSRTGYYIGVTPSGRVKGFPSESTDDAHVRLIVCPVSDRVVRLQSAETGYYLAYNATGHLYGEKKIDRDNTEWEQWNIGNYDAFRSHKYAEAGWWLGIKRNGRPKPGPKTDWGQKAIQFLQIRLS